MNTKPNATALQSALDIEAAGSVCTAHNRRIVTCFTCSAQAANTTSAPAS